MELRQYLALFHRWWWLILLLTFVGATGAFGIDRFRQPVYRATTSILINQAPGALPSADAVIQGMRVAATYAELLTKRPVLEEVIANLNLELDPSELERKVSVTPVRDTNLIELVVQDTDPFRAAAIANEIVRVFITQNESFQESRYLATLQSLQDELDKNRAEIERTEAVLGALESSQPLNPAQVTERNRLQELLAAYRNSYATLLDRYEEVRLAQVQTTDTISVVEVALPGRQVGYSTATILIIGALVGIILAVGTVLVIDYLDDTVHSASEIQTLLDLPTLGIIGRFQVNKEHPLVTVVHPRSPIAEAYRVLQTNLEGSRRDGYIRSVLVTSSNPVEGKTTTAANLAICLAQAGKRVILVDMDLRRPALHVLFNIPNRMGVTTALLDESMRGVSSQLIGTGIDNLYVMPSGPLPPNPTETLQQRSVASLLRRLEVLADIVVLDSPPVLPVADPVILSRVCNATLLVVQAESTRVAALRRACEQLTLSGATLVGAVLNRVSPSDNGYYYYNYSRSHSND